jgi:hypothetical protein
MKRHSALSAFSVVEKSRSFTAENAEGRRDEPPARASWCTGFSVGESVPPATWPALKARSSLRDLHRKVHCLTLVLMEAVSGFLSEDEEVGPG